jgi:hypothetical protein
VICSASWHNRWMTGRSKFLRFACVAIVPAVLCGCVTEPNRTASVKADEDAVRKTPAATEQRINQGDIGFVDVFAKDAVSLLPAHRILLAMTLSDRCTRA